MPRSTQAGSLTGSNERTASSSRIASSRRCCPVDPSALGADLGVAGVELDGPVDLGLGEVPATLVPVHEAEQGVAARLVIVELDSLLRQLLGARERPGRPLGPAEQHCVHVGAAEADVGGRVPRVQLDGPPEQLAGLGVGGTRAPRQPLAPAQDVVVGRKIGGRLGRCPLLLDPGHLHRERADQALHDRVLHREEVGHVLLVPFGPEVETTARVGELDAHPDAVAGPADTALDHVADPKLPPDPRRIGGLPLVGEGRAAADHAQVREAAQRRDQVLGDPVAEVLLPRVAALVGERQDGDDGRAAAKGSATVARSSRCSPTRPLRASQRATATPASRRRTAATSQTRLARMSGHLGGSGAEGARPV